MKKLKKVYSNTDTEGCLPFLDYNLYSLKGLVNVIEF